MNLNADNNVTEGSDIELEPEQHINDICRLTTFHPRSSLSYFCEELQPLGSSSHFEARLLQTINSLDPEAPEQLDLLQEIQLLSSELADKSPRSQTLAQGLAKLSQFTHKTISLNASAYAGLQAKLADLTAHYCRQLEQQMAKAQEVCKIQAGLHIKDTFGCSPEFSSQFHAFEHTFAPTVWETLTIHQQQSVTILAQTSERQKELQMHEIEALESTVARLYDLAERYSRELARVKIENRRLTAEANKTKKRRESSGAQRSESLADEWEREEFVKVSNSPRLQARYVYMSTRPRS